MAHRLDQSTRAIPQVGYRERFFPSGFFISLNIQSRQKNILLSQYLTGTTCIHTRNLEVNTLARENHVDIICLPRHSIHKMQSLDKAFMGPLKKFYCQEIEKWPRSHPGRVVTVYQIGELFGNAYHRAPTGEIAANGCRATGLFPCDQNIFRPYEFPLSSDDKDSAPVNHPALAKISDQPSFTPANFSLFTSAEISDHQISALCQAST